MTAARNWAGALLLAALSAARGATNMTAESATEKTYAMFGAGCFWCSEAVFKNQPGVIRTEVGYAGGKTPNPTYRQVCTGRTGHAEVVRIEFDSARVRYEELLDLFWRMHDPTTPNRQGADVGTQYRSAIFYYSAQQRQAAEAAKAALERAGVFSKPIVTQIVPAGEFYPAEAEHQDYYARNADAPYCRAVIRPKLEKLGFER